VNHETQHNEFVPDSVPVGHAGGVLHTTPVKGYWELLEEMNDHHMQFPMEFYVPYFYTEYRDNYGEDYEVLLSGCIHHGQTHDH
jgi:hypothetical protein